MKWLALLALAGCTQMGTDGPPIYITQNPACFLFCLTTLGAVREDVRAHGAPATGGAQSLTQTTTTATGVAP